MSQSPLWGGTDKILQTIFQTITRGGGWSKTPTGKGSRSPLCGGQPVLSAWHDSSCLILTLAHEVGGRYYCYLHVTAQGRGLGEGWSFALKHFLSFEGY